MKLKIIFLIVSASFLTYLIFIKNYENRLDILTIFDNEIYKKDYNNDIENNLVTNKKIIRFTKNKLEIEDLLFYIIENKENIQQLIYESDILIINIGEYELLNKIISTNELIDNLNNLFKEIRKYNKKHIIYINPSSLKIIYPVKELCLKHNIDFISNNEYLSNNIIANIKSKWKI